MAGEYRKKGRSEKKLEFLRVEFCCESNFTAGQRMIVGGYQWRKEDILIKQRENEYIGG